METLDANIARKEREYEEQLRAYRTLPEKHRARAVALLDEIDKKIEQLKRQAEPLEEQLDALHAERERLEREVRHAREVLAQQGNYAKAEALARVVSRVVCFFGEPEEGRLPKRSGPKPSRVLKSVRLEPRLEDEGGSPVEVIVNGDGASAQFESLAGKLLTHYPATTNTPCDSASPSPG